MESPVIKLLSRGDVLKKLLIYKIQTKFLKKKELFEMFFPISVRWKSC